MTSRLDPRARSDGRLSSGEDLGAPAPGLRILVLYVNSGCDCRCAMCEIWRDRRQLFLSPQAVAQEIAEWRAAGVERIVLSGGEPLRHPSLRQLLEALAGTPCTLLTSGMALREQAAILAQGPVDEVIVSLDGPPDLHDRLRGRADAFRRVARGVEALRQQAPGLRVSARCTVQRANLGALRATVDAALGLGLAGISFLAVDAHSEAFNRETSGPRLDAGAGSGPGLLPRATDLAALEAELALLEASHAASFERGYIAESPAKLRRRLLDHFRAELGLGKRPAVSCNAPWVSAVVETDGRMRPCFFHKPVSRWQAGVVPLLTAWRSPEALAFRQSLDVASEPLCQRCVCNLNLR